MHIVQALVSLNLGGSELVAVELSEYAAEQGHQVTVIAADGPLGQRVQDCGARLLAWPIGKKRLATLKYISRLRSWLETERPDVIHVHSRLPAWICLLAIRKMEPSLRPALVTTMHGHYSVSRYSAVMAAGDRVIAVSDHIRDYTLHNYISSDPERVITIHGGVSRRIFVHGYRPDPSWFEQVYLEFPELENRRLLCLPGRLSRYKGHADFIEMVSRLARVHTDLHGIIVGRARPGSRYRDQLEGLAERYGVMDRISFVGARTDMRDWLSASEIVYSLCADPPEAFGRTVPEALHLGTPVIGWNHGGVKETLADLFPEGAVTPGNRDELASRSRSFLDSRPEVEPSERFGLRESMHETLGVYDLVLSEKAS